jgi:hypothetical protein
VLVDPLRIRMPVATELGGGWTWNHRRDVTQWIDEPVTNIGDDALIGGAPGRGGGGLARCDRIWGHS